MQRAFNKTIIKLQNTSRIAQEQVSPRRTSCEPDQVHCKQRLMSLFFSCFRTRSRQIPSRFCKASW